MLLSLRRRQADHPSLREICRILSLFPRLVITQIRMIDLERSFRVNDIQFSDFLRRTVFMAVDYENNSNWERANWRWMRGQVLRCVAERSASIMRGMLLWYWCFYGVITVRGELENFSHWNCFLQSIISLRVHPTPKYFRPLEEEIFAINTR